MKRVVVPYMLLCAFGISTVLNILYFTNIVNEKWVRLGFAIVMTFSAIINIANLYRRNSEKKNEEKSVKNKINNKEHIYFVLSIIIGLLWLITYFIAIFNK